MKVYTKSPRRWHCKTFSIHPTHEGGKAYPISREEIAWTGDPEKSLGQANADLAMKK
jgi:hypothetical protein